MEKLKEKYSLTTAAALVFGVVVGIGIYFKAGPVLSATGGNGSYAIYTWIVASVMTICASIIICEVASASSKTGGVMSLIEILWNDKLAFVAGWAQTFIYLPAIITIILYYSAVFTFSALHITPSTTQMIILTFFYFIALGGINFINPNIGAVLNNSLSFLKALPLAGIAIFGLLYAANSGGDTENALTLTAPKLKEIPVITAINHALIPVLFAFEGWLYISTISKEVSNPKRNVPLAIIVGIAAISILYIAFNLGLLNVADGTEYAYNGKNINIFTVANHIFPFGLGNVVAYFIVISALGVSNGMIIFSFRSFYSLALRRKHPLFDKSLEVSKKTNIPSTSALMMCAVILVYLIFSFTYQSMGHPGIFDVVGDLPVTLFWGFYIIIFVGTLKARKQGSIKNEFKAPALTFLVLVASFAGLFAIYGSFSAHPMYLLVSAIICLPSLWIYKNSTER